MRLFGKLAIGTVTVVTGLFMAPAANAAEAESTIPGFPSGPVQFTLELVNESFHDSFAIANNISPGVGKLVPSEDGR
ncbi:hypothetical protein ABZ135_37085 [Streptomyces sp. NPDC006339]|uniref:hypothetical protein n=1 Tax=Streptomyces sp. NPDC006339 TaxID=3156755 RepID=UPI0033B5DDCC